MTAMKMSTKMTHAPCMTASICRLWSAMVCPIWQSTRRMLTGVPMQLTTAHCWTASHSRCTSPSGQPEQDLTSQGMSVCTVTGTCWEWYSSAATPVMRIWESHVVLCVGGAAA